MSSNPRSQPPSKPSLAQKFGRELEKHINFADKLSRNLSNQNPPSNRAELPKDQTPQDIVEPPKDLLHGASNRINTENQQNIPDLKQNNFKKEARESGVSESVKVPQFPESRKQSRNINSSAGSKRSLDRSKGSRKIEKPESLENNSYMLSNVRKTLSFKNKIIDDSMQRLKSSGSHAATRNTALKSTPAKIQENIPQKKRNNSQVSNKQPVPPQKINFGKRNSVQESSNEGMSGMTQIQRRTSHPDNETSLRGSFVGFDAVKPLESVSNDINVSYVGGIEEQLQEKAAENRSFGLKENFQVEGITGAAQQSKAAHENYEQDTNNENNRINTHFDVSIQGNESPEASNQFFKSQGSQKSKKTSSEKINEYMENSLDLQGEVLERVPRAHLMKKETERNPINMTHDEALGFSSFSKDFDRTGSVDWFHSNALSIEKAKDEAREEEKLEASVLKDEGSLEKQLEEAVYKIDIKTFLTLRSIIKPHRAVLLCCEGLIRLFAGIEDIPAHFSSKENFDWSEIKALFTNPIQFVSLVSSFKSFVYGGKVRPQRIENLELTLSKIEVHLDAPNLEAFEQIYRFLGLAMKFYRDCEINNTIPEFIEEEPKQVRPEPVSYTPNDVRTREVENSQKPRNIQRKKNIQAVEENNKHKGLSNVNASFSNQKDDRKVKARSVSKSPVKSVQGKVVQSAVKRLTQSKERELQKEESVRIDDEAEVSEVDELKDDIETGERNARDYRSKVKRMLADHDRFVKKQVKEQADLEDEWNRACEIEDWQKTNELLNQQANNEKELKHIRNVEYIMEKKEAMEQKIKEEKENQNEVLLESLQDHYYQSYMIQQKKEEQQKELQEKCQNVLVNRAEKKQKEALDSASKKAELDRNRRDHYASKKIDVEIEKNKWQQDFLMLSKLLGNGK